MTRTAHTTPGRRRPAPRATTRWRPLRSLRARRILAALLAAVTVGLLAHLALSRPDPDDVVALVAVRDVPVGALVGRSDVELRHLPARALPRDALTDPSLAEHRRAAVPLVAGRVLVPDDLRHTALLDGLEEGTLATYLPLAEPEVPAALESGDRVDVHSPLDGTVVVTGALVLRSASGERPGVWVAVDRPGAQALAAARGSDPAGASMQVSLHPGDDG